MTLLQIGKLVQECYLRYTFRRVDTVGQWARRGPSHKPADRAEKLRLWLRRRYPV